MTSPIPEPHTIHGLDMITKDWSNFGFKFIKKSDYPAVLALLQDSYYRDEPTCQILGCPPERCADMNQKISDVMDLNQGSFYAYPLDKPGKVAAVLLIWIQEEGKALPQREIRSPITGVVNDVFSKLFQRYNVSVERNASVEPELYIVATDMAYRGRGLATEMYRKAIAGLKSKGYPFVSSSFTNPLSRKIGDRLGFQTVSRLEFDECRYPDGTPVFGNAGKSHFIVEAVLDLQ